MRLPVALLALALCVARGAPVDRVLLLINQLAEVSQQEPPLSRLDTLLSAAEVLPPGAFELPRRRLLDDVAASAATLRDEDTRYFFLTATAHLLAAQDRDAAEQLCRQIGRRNGYWRVDHRGRCWQFLITADRAAGRGGNATMMEALRSGAFHIPDALRALQDDPLNRLDLFQYLLNAYPGAAATPDDARLLRDAARAIQPVNSALAREALGRIRNQPLPDAAPATEPPASADAPPEPAPESPETIDQSVERLTARIESPATSGAEKFGAVDALKNTAGNLPPGPRRLELLAYVTGWMRTNGQPGAADAPAAFLHNTIRQLCDCTGQGCDTLARQNLCGETLDNFVEYLAARHIDPTALQVRHPTLRARLLLFELRQTVKEP